MSDSELLGFNSFIWNFNLLYLNKTIHFIYELMYKDMECNNDIK